MPKIAVNGTQVSYTRAGSGAPIILLHSSASSKEQWDAVRHRLQDRFEVLAVDLHGYGETGGWRGADEPTLADEAALVTARLDIVAEAGHMMPTSHPEAVIAAITRHLDAQLPVDELAA